ncbi:MAG: flagellar biosynthetic protein FliO [Desulfobacterales bacterium]|nr:flagellar biosynthetic protein FliO [Desulfobacterales bacterium]
MGANTDMGYALIKIMAMLFVVLALLLLLFYLIRKFSNPVGSRGRQDLISVLATHYLSPKEKLVLINLAGRTLLIGVTPGTINTLHVLDQELVSEPADPKAASLFANLLKGRLKDQGDQSYPKPGGEDA